MDGGFGRPAVTLRKALALPLVGLALALLVAAERYEHFVNAPLEPAPGSQILLVERGATVRSVVTGLDGPGYDWRWRILTRLHPVTIKAGEYELTGGMTPLDLLALLSSGAVVRYRFTIVEGWTWAQLLQALAANPVLAHEVAELDGSDAVLRAVGSEATHPEGWFLPETYQFVRGDSDLDILSRAHAAMAEVLQEAWARRDDRTPLKSPYELLILASIVERESSLESERADIAGVFNRRLLAGWRLETDPTVIYGLGDRYDGNIRRRDLDADTPYNTYTRFGLPPTPIAMPGKSALAAAANPAPGTSMFFVASGAGGHVFSDTLEEHNKAVRRMLDRKP